jgi:serine/threonine-protein kinase
MSQACQSLAEAHEAGLLHRDIKPANLFTCRAADEVDVLKVLDFGIVHTVTEPLADSVELVKLPPRSEVTPSGRLTQAGSLVGTPGYIAPEQAVGVSVDARADLYALGCVAWWLLTGREVFARDGDPPILRRHIHEPVPRLRDAMTGWCPAELEAAITACLAKDAADRPADARALAALLRAIPIPAEQAWTEARAQSWWRAWQPPVPAPSVSTSAIQLIMPGRIELEP